jgi:hypothetical protein
MVPNVEVCVRNHLVTGSKMHFNLPCKSEGKVSKFYLMQHADQESRDGKRPDQLPDLEPTSLTHEQTLSPVFFREDVMDYDIKAWN